MPKNEFDPIAQDVNFRREILISATDAAGKKGIPARDWKLLSNFEADSPPKLPTNPQKKDVIRTELRRKRTSVPKRRAFSFSGKQISPTFPLFLKFMGKLVELLFKITGVIIYSFFPTPSHNGRILTYVINAHFLIFPENASCYKMITDNELIPYMM